eukprot:247875-Rhodomonas_salina.1
MSIAFLPDMGQQAGSKAAIKSNKTRISPAHSMSVPFLTRHRENGGAFSIRDILSGLEILDPRP